jgi:hypothetical protein
MAERHRSKDGSRDTDKVVGAEGEVSHEGREGGDLARKKATKDEMKRALEQPAGATRVTKSDEREKDDNE